MVENDFLAKVKVESLNDYAYQRTVKLVGDGTAHHYWFEDGLLRAKGNKIYVPNGFLRRQLLKENHDTPWAGHLGVERMNALMSWQFYWPCMWDDVELYVKNCLVCQQDKLECKKEAGLLQALPILDQTLALYLYGPHFWIV